MRKQQKPTKLKGNQHTNEINRNHEGTKKKQQKATKINKKQTKPTEINKNQPKTTRINEVNKNH